MDKRIYTKRKSCLLYFVQFLKDLGVQATADIRHEADDVLFSVTPSNKDEALETIKLALELYLQLPSNPAVSMPSEYSMAIPVQQLVANIQHLNTQLMLTQSALQLKDATIQALQTTIVQQRQVLTGQIILDSLQRIETPDRTEDKEQLLGGAVALTKYEGDGFELNVPLIYRWLKGLWKRSRGLNG